MLAALGLLLGGLVLDQLSGTRAISFTVHLTDWATGSWLFLPPLGLVIARLRARRRAPSEAHDQ